MAQKKWKVSKILYCEHVGHEIKLETQVVYPAEHLPVPRKWVQRIRRAMETLVPKYNTWRMVQEYTQKYYVPC
jgi:glucan phosphorylase